MTYFADHNYIQRLMEQTKTLTLSATHTHTHTYTHTHPDNITVIDIITHCR
jgi:hypothetical protein